MTDIGAKAAPKGIMAVEPTRNCVNGTTLAVDQEDSSPDAFVYIVVVLTFYALAMTILMVKYIRRENQEAQLSYYFHEFINREKFHTPRYQNRQGVTAIKKTLNKFYQSMGLVEAEKGSPAHENRGSKDDSSDKEDLQHPELIEVCSVSDSGVGSEASSNHHGSSSIMIEDCAEGLRSDDDDLLIVEGSTRLTDVNSIVPCGNHKENILPQLNLLESAV